LASAGNAGKITVNGEHGPADYLLRDRPAPNVAIHVPAAATEQDVLQGLMDLAPAE
jgi:hypothetical protein